MRRFKSRIKEEIEFSRLVLAHDRTPRVARWLLGLGIAYAASPIDVIPDFIPVLGHLDDIIIVPALLAVGIKLIPRDVIEECRRASRSPSS
jgi:uncharacterized membrane protein YkvA (DUF1232 family)